MTKALEYRSTFEVRADAEAGGFSGYAATFNRVDSYGTAFSPDAFKKTLAERGDKIPVLYQHNPEANVGVPEVLKADDTGLAVEARLFDDGADGSVLLKRLRQGARFGMSFGFQTIQSRAAEEDDDLDLAQVFDAELFGGIRMITEVKLYEVSIVSFPANDAAVVTDVRNAALADSLAAALEAVRDGSLTERQRALVEAIVAAYPHSSPAGTTAPRAEPEIARRRLDAEIALARYRQFAV